MLKKMRGFTLIELLIVVAIIGILAVLLVPNAITAIQKAKQKNTMKSITTIATAVADYITDHGQAPVPTSQDLVATDPFYDALAPFYVRVLPENDEWGLPFQVFANAAGVNGQYGITNALDGDFLICSFARDNTQEGWTFDEDAPEAGYFVIDSMDDFNYDLVSFSGSWIRAPRALMSTT